VAGFSRRSILRVGAVGAGSVMHLSAPVAASVSAAPRGESAVGSGFPDADRKTVARPKVQSKNGWDIEDEIDEGGEVMDRPVAGTDLRVAVRIGDVETILIHIIKRFHYEISSLSRGDVVGYQKPGSLPSGYQSNRASGTAVVILPGHYPPGTSGGLFSYEKDIVRDILSDCEGVVKWGGDFVQSGARPDELPDEGHFQIDVPPADVRLERVARKLRIWGATPGLGAGGAAGISPSDRLAAVAETIPSQRG
jgi:hypothetical protein